MFSEAKADYIEQGFSRLVEQHLEKYFDRHSEGEIPPGLHERIVNEVEKVVIDVTMKYVNGNQLKASKILGINRNTLRKRMIKFAEKEK